eukprot:SAG31_NODE_41184_length_277_cov_0.853933_1_plen_42_part_10
MAFHIDVAAAAEAQLAARQLRGDADFLRADAALGRRCGAVRN